MSGGLPWQRAAQGAHLLDDDGRPRPTIFEELTELARLHGAINLGQGFPDADGPQELRDIARGHVADGLNQYAPGRGLPVLRQAVAAHQQRFYGLTPDPDDEVLVTTGATEAIAACILGLVSPGDEVVTLEPFYDSYGALLSMAGAVHKTIPLRWPDFQPRAEDIAAAITPGTRMVFLNTPHNPTGTVLATEALALIASAAERAGAVIVSDEVYEHLVFDGSHVPVATLPGAWDRTLTIGSAGETFSLTGWKVGWITGPRDLVAAVRTVKQFLSYSSGGPFQAAVAHGLGYPDAFFAAVASDLASKRELLASALTDVGFRVNAPAAGYFLMADAADLGVDDAVALARELPSTTGVAAVPVGVFALPGNAGSYASLLRFAFCKHRDVLTAAGRALSEHGVLRAT
ncbi:aminotransferase class I/II-fold pyridoxal phosphate-dependent enzyme [Zafaria sp. J156]|uniref:aminotransferase class I/II-fold pyridoxal phosphate-dependent enzyme n=1 Tax=Zafaria sp. J156 TaxID=3116490 RepID=UPI002E787DE6|nr:aminotransferase class I/II-fold pyridoxal phosphate-dependent enzyme [Zafaria sp. J156]MEE1620734.1 aminotransferase class I/II-fold pyridoxal phosphate-dependent enzyme [Zafaria sp. J156]